MKKTTKKIGRRAEAISNFAQHATRDLADHELKVVAGGTGVRDNLHRSTCII